MGFDYSHFKYSLDAASLFFAIKSDNPEFDCWKFFESTAEKYSNLHNLNYRTNGNDYIFVEGSIIRCKKNDKSELLAANISGWDIQTNKTIRDLIYKTKKLFGIPVLSITTSDEDFVNYPSNFDVVFITEDIHKQLSVDSGKPENDFSSLYVSIDKIIDIIQAREGSSFIDRIEIMDENHKKLFFNHKRSSQKEGVIYIDIIDLEADKDDPLIIWITMVGENIDILTTGWISNIFDMEMVFIDSFYTQDGVNCFKFKYNNPAIRAKKIAPMWEKISQNPLLANYLLNNLLSHN